MAAQSEFSLIEQFFAQCTANLNDDVVLGIGDDCALIEPPAGQQLAISVDTLICGVHFPAETTPFDIGYKALAVNLSDLAAMAASPAWATLAITLPSSDSSWLSEFCRGFAELANKHNISLIGGDTTKGEQLTITVQIAGYVAPDRAVKRTGAKVGDTIFVTGELGSAALGLAIVQQRITLANELHEKFISALNNPQAQCHYQHILQCYASSCLDISDGLLADLSHILKASGVGARLHLTQIPMDSVLHEQQLESLALNGGDDYQLCFTVPQDRVAAFKQQCQNEQLAFYEIGEITASGELLVLNAEGEPITLSQTGYDHFQAL